MLKRIRRLLLAGLAVSVLLSSVPRASVQTSTLTDAERQAGWRLLFDGASMDQWRGYQKPDATGLRWMIKDGCLALPAADGTDTHGERDLITKQQFTDFELSFEWNISRGGNSGVKYLVTESHESAIGHEYQIIDDERHEDATLRNRRTASFYDVLAAPAAHPRPAGEFNTGRILVTGTHVEHWLNGVKVLEYELGSDALRSAVAGSKFKDIAGFDQPGAGHLLLQDHGAAICFRNIKVRGSAVPE